MIFFSESLRLYPPSVAMDRHCVKKYTLPANPPIEVNPGDGLWVPIYALHRDPEHFPNPDAFDPERFSDENKHNIKPSTYIPFGIGPRICIGSRFALMEAKIALVKLLYRFNLKVVSKTPIPIKICKKSMNMNIEGGYWIGLEMRNTQLNSH
ncbi:Cytochrome P450 9e2 [Blattella germanica]|nr:Cytochrome P450 9e2 [Blattella germanica]